MKRKKLFRACMIALLLIITTTVVVVAQTPPPEENIPDPQVTGLEFDRDVYYPGETMTVTLAYSIDADDEQTYYYSVAVFEIVETEGESPDDTTLVAKSNIVVDTIDKNPFEMDAPSEGDYRLVAKIWPADVEPEISEIKSVDCDNGEGCYFKKIIVKSELPSGIVQMFAGLSIFIAVMMVMALGVEVVLDVLRLILGMKRKVTAMEAFDKMKKELPGKLSTLGVSAERQKEVLDFVDSTASKLQVSDTLDGYEKFENIIQKLLAGFPDVLKDSTKELTKEHIETINEQLDTLNKAVKEFVEDFGEKLHINPTVLLGIQNVLTGILDQHYPRTYKELFELVDLPGKIKDSLSDQGPRLLSEWSGWLLDTLPNAIELDHYEASTTDALVILGFENTSAQKAVNDVRNKVAISIDEVRHAANHYTDSLSKLLKGVKDGREATQGPAGRLSVSWLVIGFCLTYLFLLLFGETSDIWNYNVLVVIVSSLVFGWLGCYVIDKFKPEEDGKNDTMQEVCKVIAIVSVAAFFVDLNLILFFRTTPMNAPPWRWHDWSSIQFIVTAAITLIYALMMVVFLRKDKKYNPTLRDAGDFVRDVLSEQELEVDTLTATNVAATLMKLDINNRNIEANRIRWLRLFSIVIGITLAVWLEVDALDLLAEVIPNASFGFNQPLDNIIPGATPGMLLTGFAASVGSNFWHDLLDRLQITKKQAEGAARTIREVRVAAGALQDSEQS